MDDCHRFGINDGCKISCPVLISGECESYIENRDMLTQALFETGDKEILDIMSLYEDMDINLVSLRSHAENWMMELDDVPFGDDVNSDRDSAKMAINDFIMYLGGFFDKHVIDANVRIHEAKKLIEQSNDIRLEAFERLAIK